ITNTEKDAAKDPQQLIAAGAHLYLADGDNGVIVFDVSAPARPRAFARVADVPAYGLWLDGPTLHVAAGAKGIAAIDVRDPRTPRVVSAGFDLNGGDTATVTAPRIAVMVPHSRPHPTGDDAQ